MNKTLFSANMQRAKPRSAEETLATDDNSEQYRTKLTVHFTLTLRLLMSYIYIYMELLVKPGMLTSYICGPTFGNAETVSFYLLHNVSTLNQCREVSCVTFVFKHFAS